MRTAFARIGNALFLLAFVGLLGWGGLQAHSADAALSGNAVAADHCTSIGGECSSDTECRETCRDLGFTSGNCITEGEDHCCYCLE